MSIDDILERDLTPLQRGAATDPANEVLTLACAGSGKSLTLAYRIAWLVDRGESPASIVAFTFTEKAADSIKLRVARALQACQLEPTVLGAMYIGTIHSYCQSVLREMDARRRQFDVLDENRLKLYLISRYPQLGLQRLRSGARPNVRYFEVIRRVSDAWKLMNDEMVDAEDVAHHAPDLAGVLAALRDQLDADEFIDFSLMVRLVVEGLQTGHSGARRAVERLQHLMVDEYQDVNPSQEALIQQLHQHSSSLFVVGDDDQAIYGWRGADVNNILTFRDRYPDCSEHTLSHNFRSTPAIVTASDGLAAAELGATRIPKDPTADEPPGARDFRNLWFATRQEEAEWVADRVDALLGTEYRERDGENWGPPRGLTPGDFAILMRSTRQPERDGTPRHAAFTRALGDRGIRFTLEAGGGLFERPEVRALRDTFLLLRQRSPKRDEAEQHFNSVVRPCFPQADFGALATVLAEWGRLIHAPIAGTRRRVYPQRLVHDLLNAFGVERTQLDAAVMRDLGVFSRIIQDVEAVYVSIDTTERFQDILNFLQNVADTGYDTGTEDILRRPDAVAVSTVHRAKGLEFPVVFVVDAEAERFPGRRRRYDGWIPAATIQAAMQRGAYQGTPEEEARLFYTAVTRAERFLHVSGCERLPGGRRTRRPSMFAQRLQHDEMTDDHAGLPQGLVACDQAPRIDEAVMPTSFSDIRYYLNCPRDYQFRKSYGFSPAIPELFGFGVTTHTAVGRLHEEFQDRAPSADEAERVARAVFHVKHVPPSGDPDERPGAYERARDSAARMVRSYAETYAPDFSQQRQLEVRFEIPVRQAVISGSIDLILRVDAGNNIVEATVIDLKTTEGGEEPEESEQLRWTELALQVQLYVMAAREVLGENARTGAVHLLKDNQRVEVPITDEAVEAAIRNVEWAADRILSEDFPMRPATEKCNACDFKSLCPKVPEQFDSDVLPPPIHIPGRTATRLARAFSEFEG